LREIFHLGCRIRSAAFDWFVEANTEQNMTDNRHNINTGNNAAQNRSSSYTNIPWALLGGDWLLCPYRMVLAGAWIVWAVCTVGFYWLRSDAGHRPGAFFHELLLSAAVGAVLAVPLVVAALLLRLTGATGNTELSC
jgi:hypothetical protein